MTCLLDWSEANEAAKYILKISSTHTRLGTFFSKAAAQVNATWRDSNGSTAAMFGLSLPALMVAAGVATDFGLMQMKHSKLQSAADQAALAGARELSLASANDDSIKAAADEFARAALNDTSLDITVEAEIDNTNNKVRVTLTETWTPFFAHFLGAKVTPVAVAATAGLFGEAKICVLTLTTTEPGALSMTKDSHLQADGCTVYSNSSHASSVFLADTSSVNAKLVCTVGGVKDNGSLSADQVITDCPVLKDPLASRPGLTVGSCDFTKMAINSGTHALRPGVYCGGLTITGTAVANLDPGEYIIKDGPLMVHNTATLKGDNVGFFLTGQLGVVHFRGDATIDINGREEGPMAGMLIFDDPKQTGLLRVHSVSAKNAINLTGTIYLPNGNLMVDPTATVGQQSAYTAIVAKRLIVQNGPTLVLNTNYDKTPVPVPEGIRAAADIHLVD